MKKFLIGSLKIIIPLGLGLFLVWWFYSDLTTDDKTAIVNAFEAADYSWVLISLVVATLSHVSRAYRWKYTLEPLGYKPDFVNSFAAVMIGYLVNLAVPRLGELSRCGSMARYEKIPFEKLLGTVIAERVADLLILISVTLTVAFLQYEIIQELLNELLSTFFGKINAYTVLGLMLGGLIAGVTGLFFIYRIESNNKVIQLIQKVMKGIVEGVISIVRMKRKWSFIGHTIFIWGAYLAMFYLCFFALPETASVPIGGVLTAFVLGGITIALTNGGIGAYPIAVQSILMLYEVDKNIGGAFGWIVWTAQTILILALGAIAFWGMPFYNRKFKKHGALESPST